MKIALFVICVLGATAAFGQASLTGSGLSNEPVIIQVPTHPQHAAQQSLGSSQSLLESSSYTSAKGERPLWEVAVPSQQTPLGDSARALKKEHATLKKAKRVWQN